MRGAEHNVDCVRLSFQHRRHGIEHNLDPLDGGERAKDQDDGVPAEAQGGLGCSGFYEGKVWNAMWNDLAAAG